MKYSQMTSERSRMRNFGSREKKQKQEARCAFLYSTRSAPSKMTQAEGVHRPVYRVGIS